MINLLQKLLQKVIKSLLPTPKFPLRKLLPLKSRLPTFIFPQISTPLWWPPKMARCFSFTATRDYCYRYGFVRAGMTPTTVDFHDGTTMHCWVPKAPKKARPNLLCIHGFGANAMWQWAGHLRALLAHYNVYIPDLLFFGESYTTLPDRTESFQARCVIRLMQELGVTRMSVAGISYGGFVAYQIAALFPEAVDQVVLCCTGVCLEPKDLEQGLFKVSDLDAAVGILIPQTPAKLRELMRFSFCKPPRPPPSCFLEDFIHVMCTEYVKEKKELIMELVKDRKCSEMPRITQPTLIIWGEQDQIFPLELGHRLKGHIGDNAELVVIKNAGHAVNLEKPKEFFRHLKRFLIEPLYDRKIDSESLLGKPR
ncbi:uncharacterized protein LOC116259363 [Nymphaea colorata]|nr:uncharacterized protein LOC116259363 [Nymphaea colorata]